MSPANHSVTANRFRALALTATLSVAMGSDSGEGLRAWVGDEHMAHSVETQALSSVSGLVPARETVRRAQAIAIVEARRLGVDLSIASFGSGGKARESAAADGVALARLARRFPDTVKAILERDAYRERLAKAWDRPADPDREGDRYNASAEVISNRHGPASACVVELHSSGESLRDLLAMSFHDGVLDRVEARARMLGITANDVAFLAAAHESAHCVIGVARRAGILDTTWADALPGVPQSWASGLTPDDRDLPALAKTEESAADLLAVLWAGDVLGKRKARRLARLSLLGVSLGAREGAGDDLHDSSRALTRFLAMSQPDRRLGVEDRTRGAWEMAASATRAELLEPKFVAEGLRR